MFKTVEIPQAEWEFFLTKVEVLAGNKQQLSPQNKQTIAIQQFKISCFHNVFNVSKRNFRINKSS